MVANTDRLVTKYCFLIFHYRLHQTEVHREKSHKKYQIEYLVLSDVCLNKTIFD